jgi:hypothetical protein
MIDSGRLCIWLQLGQSLKIRLISHFVRRQLGRWRLLDGRVRYCRLAGVQDDFLRPFLRRSDPDNCLVDDFRSVTESRRRLRQAPVGYEKQSSERASDEHEIPSLARGAANHAQRFEQPGSPTTAKPDTAFSFRRANPT